MPTLDELMPLPRLRELDSIEVAASPKVAFAAARHFDLARVPIAATLFWLRDVPERLRWHESLFSRPHLRFDELGQEDGGFTVLVDEPARFVVGAIGRFWLPEMQFAATDAARFAAFADAGYGKIVWEVRSEPSTTGARIVFELRLSATDDESWRAFQRYYRLIAPFSRFMRRHGLQIMAQDAGLPKGSDAERGLPGDALLPNARASATHSIVIDAAPSAVFPWLVQMGCRRAGWYSHDDLDNGGVRSAVELVPELQQLAIGDVLAATPDSEDGFTVLALDAPHVLVLGGLFDTEHERSVDFYGDKPRAYWQITWTFVLEPIEGGKTRLLVRARADYAPETFTTHLHARGMKLVHGFMEHAQLEHLKARVEGRAPRVENTWTDVAEAIAGAARMIGHLATSFLRVERSHWGMTAAEAAQPRAGDELVPDPRWSWTHAVTLTASPEEVWPWIAQLGQDRAGFYSYQVLENLAGCAIQNASHVHPEWRARVGDALRLHPQSPPLKIVVADAPHALIACAGMEEKTGRAPGPDYEGEFVAVSWAFLIERIDERTTRVISRYRCACSDDAATKILYGPTLLEPVGFEMDRRMLLGVKERVERQRVEKRAREAFEARRAV